MTLYVAFLRGINLGKRQMKMADLKACLEEAGYAEVKTILASGNVRFLSDDKPAPLKDKLEKLLQDRFGFPVGVVLRTADQLEALLKANPFASLDPKADVARHVLFSDKPIPQDIDLPGLPGHTEIVHITAGEIFIAGYRQPNGRYTEGVEEALKPYYQAVGKNALDTMRNWNTLEKVLP